jgi:hypothetical protein
MEHSPGTSARIGSVGTRSVRSVIGLRTMLPAVALCAILTLPAAWNARQFISSDGISYLEVAANTIEHGPHDLLTNAYWSPAYPALLAGAMKLTHPSVASELAVVHSLDWAICVATYFCFTYFLINLLRWIHLAHGPVFESGAALFGIVAFAYSLLYVSNLDMSLWYIGPNVMIEGVVYLIAGLCIRLSLPDSRYAHQAALGALLALGYVTKAVLFPLSLALLAIFFVWPVSRSLGRKGIAVAAVVFLLAASPFVAILSYSKGRLTFGDAGRLTYAFYVNAVPRYWEVRLPDSAPLRHPPRIISTDPPIVKFDDPFHATYSYWYDPSYWYDGIQSHFNLRQQVQQLLLVLGLAPKTMISGFTVFQLAKRWIPIWAGLAAFIVLGLRIRNAYGAMGTHLWLFLWCAGACFTFACVLTEYRYLLPFVVLGWTALFVAASVATGAGRSIGVNLTVAAGLLLIDGPAFAKFVIETQRQPAATRNSAVAGKLAALGIRPGDEVASAGLALDVYYARLVGARFTIEMPTADPVALSRLPEAQVRQTLATLRANGAKALFSTWRPAFANDSGWEPIGQHDYVRMLQ